MFLLRNHLLIGATAASLLLTPLAGIANDGAPLPLDPVLTPATLWETDSTAFFDGHKELGFRWISAAEDVAQNVRPGTTLYGLPVCQTLVRMKDGKVHHVTVMFYNRGDMGDLRRPQYEELLVKVRDAIKAALGSEPKQRGRDAASAVRAFGLEWPTAEADYLLEYSFTRENQAAGVPYRAEFIRLEISPKEAPKTFMAEAFSSLDKPAKYLGPNQVARKENGDVFIKDVPMVDQGEKGYCVVASVERVMRLYGMKVDANELAQLANADADRGTNANEMTESLKRLTARLKIRVRTQISWEYQRFTRFIDTYNQQARRAKEPLITIGGRQSISEIYGAMNADVLRETKARSKSEFTAFQRHVKTHIDKGVPMLWSLMMGVIPEPNYRGTVGGHMRLIIGYNERTEELIYSDSWGLNHEFKKMPIFDAFCVTTNLASVEPQ